MKILLVNTWYYPNIEGGAEQSTKLLAENLVKAGNEVAVYCIDSETDEMTIEIINGVRIYRGNGGGYLKKIKNEGKFNKLWIKYKDIYNYKSNKEIMGVINDFNPEIVHTNCLNGISISIWKRIKSAKIPILHTLRDYALISPRGILEIKAERKGIYQIYLYLHKYICKKYSNIVDGVTAPSKFTVNIFTDNGYFKNAKCTRCVVNSIEYSNDELINNIKFQEKKQGEIINFLFVGRLLELKGLKKLVEEFKKIKDKNIRLIICGDGNLRKYILDSEVEDSRIIYKGKLTQAELKNIYMISDVLIVPSIWDEPFGRVVIEGNYYGMPVIASNRGGIPEIIDTLNGGISYNSEDNYELRNAIIKLSNRDLYSGFRQSIINNMYNYDISQQIENFISIYRKLLE
ncbi:glycosyltransferase family 4 protein [Clostridium saudiense]|uniref:Glycosyltransferase family 4 protein n=1 Tax=Clostridium saudiense TaxID=1414720 RepID=A0ABS2FIQ5_9CLOT|nr:glycosyltransferase family 4 protein [Clostridium saudiense]MBM6820167.1 glycosyltransferase family 4 protein [Clostridium saudiense]